MATVEERLTAIEHKYVDLKHDNDELKKNVELHTIAIGALVNKGTLEKIMENRITGVEDKLEQILDLLAGQGPRS